MDKICITVGELGVNCYIIFLDDEAVVIDPGDEPERILDRIKNRKLSQIWLTHGHFDHTGAVNRLKKETGAKVLISKEDAPMLTDPDKSLYNYFKPKMKFDPCEPDGYFENKVMFLNRTFYVFHTPGHSAGSVCFFGDEVLFSGDTILKASIGRTDFGDPQAMKRSLLLATSVPEKTMIFPGHGNVTSLDRELRHNPYLRAAYGI